MIRHDRLYTLDEQAQSISTRVDKKIEFSLFLRQCLAMPAPKPLTETPAPTIDWSRPGTPAASDFDDIYFSVEGGLEETETVFLKGCGLPEGWEDRPVFAIGELGFGTGLNFLAAWRVWDQTHQEGQRLHFVSVEKFPLDRTQLKQALSPWTELAPWAERLIAAWPGRVRGFHRIEFGSVTLTLIHDDIIDGLDQLSAQVDAWFLDGFSPAKNPEMWSELVMKKLADLSRPGTRLATFSVAGFVREGLKGAGFFVEKKPGFGRKRHRLEARFGEHSNIPTTDLRPIIIGAGIGGASLARAFQSRGIEPIIIDAIDSKAASGNPAAIVKPRLDLQDRPETRFFLSSYLYALRAYGQIDCVIARGITQLGTDDTVISRHTKLADQKSLPERHMLRGDQGELMFPDGLVIDPIKARNAFIGDLPILKARVSRIEQTEFDVRVMSNGEVVAEGTHVILALGAGLRQFETHMDLPVRYSRGQLTWAKASVHSPVTFGGYAIPMGDEALIGATHDRLDARDPYELRTESDTLNVEKYETALGTKPTLSDRVGRASVRANMPDTLPRIIRKDDRTHIMTGLGSRGFVFAPLLAEAWVSDLTGEPMPISKQMWARFQAREKPNLRARPLKSAPTT